MHWPMGTLAFFRAICNFVTGTAELTTSSRTNSLSFHDAHLSIYTSHEIIGYLFILRLCEFPPQSTSFQGKKIGKSKVHHACFATLQRMRATDSSTIREVCACLCTIFNGTKHLLLICHTAFVAQCLVTSTSPLMKVIFVSRLDQFAMIART